jgi:Laminin G domain
VVRLGFDDVRVQGDRVVTRNGADTQVEVRVLRAGDGSVSVVRGAGGGRGLRFPGVSSSATPARAVLAVTTKESVDRVNGLSPGHHDFEFGARFMLDRTSEIAELDNGNNLVQRGLGDDLSQYKLQVDHRRVSCRIAGDLGGVEPRSRMRIDPEHWYSVTCARTGRTVTLRVRRLDDHAVDRVTLRGDTGSVTASASTPLAVGGKVTDQGRVIRGNSDQFNGLIDDVFLDVGADG